MEKSIEERLERIEDLLERIYKEISDPDTTYDAWGNLVELRLQDGKLVYLVRPAY